MASGSISAAPSRYVATRGDRWRNVKSMTLVWTAFGAVIGAGTSPPHGGPVGVISGILAGVILFPLIGAVLGILGCRPRPTLLVGAFGMVLGGIILTAVSSAMAAAGACFGLVAGGLVGATVLPVIRFYKRVLRFAVQAPLAISASRRVD